MQNLFVYGSLLFPYIMEGLTGRKFKTSEATLYGYKRHRVLGADYPAIIDTKDATVDGKLVFDVDPKSLALLTFFEGDEFSVREVKISLPNEEVTAFAFIWKTGLKYLDETDWDKTVFQQESLQYYIREIVPETVTEFKKFDAEL